MDEAARVKWNQRHAGEPEKFRQPDEFFVSAYEEFVAPAFPHGGDAVDVAGGPGRHALYLAEHGWRVTLVDISEVAVGQAQQRAADRGLRLATSAAECTAFEFGRERFDLVLVFYFLERDLFPALFAALRPGGMLIYKTHTLDQLKFDFGPKSPEHLLKPNELLWAFGQMRILHYRETWKERGAAELVARRQ